MIALVFALIRSLIGPGNSRHFLNQSDATLTPSASWLPAFSRALGSLRVLTLSSHWGSSGFFPFHLIGCYLLFWFGFTTLNRKARN